jgi:hypothetical protein
MDIISAIVSIIDLVIDLAFINICHIRMTYKLSCDIFLYLNKKNRCNARVHS